MWADSIHFVDLDHALPPFISNQMSAITAFAGEAIPEDTIKPTSWILMTQMIVPSWEAAGLSASPSRPEVPGACPVALL